MIFSDVIALPAGKDRWIVVNVFTRIAAGVDSAGLAIINGADSQSKDFPFWDIARFSNVDGLLADPSRLFATRTNGLNPSRMTPLDCGEH